MRHLIFIFLLLFSLPALGQIRPDQFPEKETATGTDEIYTQSGGVAYRIVFDTAKTFFAPDIDQVALAYSIDSSGANVVDSLRGRFVLDAGGNWWYVDYDKTAVSIGTAGGGGGSGETNTMANVGDGTGIYYQKDGVQFQLKSLKAGGVASLSNTDTTITITATEVDGSIANELDTITIAGDSGSVDISDAETLTIAGAGIATTAVSGNTLTVTATELDGSTTNELGTVSSITTVPDTSGLSPVQGDAFINATADTLGLYSGAGWVLFYGGGGGGATTGIVLQADGTDTLDLSVYGTIQYLLDSVSSVETMVFTPPAQWQQNNIHIKDASIDTIFFPPNLLIANGDTMGVRLMVEGEILSFYYDGVNYYAPTYVGASIDSTGWGTVDLSLTKTASSSSVSRGDTVTFYLAINNPSSFSATNVIVKDYLPDSLSNVHSISNSGSINGTSDTITWTVSSISPSSIDTLTFAAQVDGAATNTAEITTLDQSDNNSSNNTDTKSISISVPNNDTIQNTSGLVYYYHADSLALSNGSSVSLWEDLSGNGYDVSQATSAEQPVFQTAQINGKAALNFDGDACLFSAGEAWTADSLTVFVVADLNTSASTESLVSKYQYSETERQWAVNKTSSNKLALVTVDDGTAGLSLLTTGDVPFNFSLYSGYANASSGQLRIDGVSKPLDTSTTETIIDATTPIACGCNGDDTTKTNFLTGKIAMIAVFNKELSAAEIADIETYINNQYALY